MAFYDTQILNALQGIDRSLKRIAVALEKDNDPVTVVDAALDAAYGINTVFIKVHTNGLEKALLIDGSAALTVHAGTGDNYAVHLQSGGSGNGGYNFFADIDGAAFFNVGDVFFVFGHNCLLCFELFLLRAGP